MYNSNSHNQLLFYFTFQIIKTVFHGDFFPLERPLHYTENVLEQILHWSSLPNPGSACLIMKRFPAADNMKLYNGMWRNLLDCF